MTIICDICKKKRQPEAMIDDHGMKYCVYCDAFKQKEKKVHIPTRLAKGDEKHIVRLKAYNERFKAQGGKCKHCHKICRVMHIKTRGPKVTGLYCYRCFQLKPGKPKTNPLVERPLIHDALSHMPKWQRLLVLLNPEVQKVLPTC